MLPLSVGRPRGRWATRANGLTALRLLAAPALALAVVGGASSAALLLFAVGVVTDLVDGRVARRFGESSPLGGLLDHAADASFVTAGLGALAVAGSVPVALPVLVALAFAQYAFDSGALRPARPGSAPAGARPLRASALGRCNGIAYFVLLGVPVVRDGLGLAWPPAALLRWAALLLVATTLVSMGDRARAQWRARPGPPGR